MIGKPADVDGAFEGPPVHLGRRRRKHDVDAALATKRHVIFERAWVTREIVRVVELERVHEYRNHHDPAVAPGGVDQRRVSGMQRAHGGNERPPSHFVLRAAATFSKSSLSGLIVSISSSTRPPPGYGLVSPELACGGRAANGSAVACTSATNARAASTMIPARLAYLFANGGILLCRPSRSELTSTCPSQSGPAPIPTVGTSSDAVMRAASSEGIASSTTANAPASCSASASLKMSSASCRRARAACTALLIHRLRQYTEMPHHRDAHIDEPRTTSITDCPPSTLTAAAPASFSKASIANRLRRRDLIGEKRHVGDDQRSFRSTHHRGGVMNHHLEGDGQRGVVAEHRRRDGSPTSRISTPARSSSRASVAS